MTFLISPIGVPPIGLTHPEPVITPGTKGVGNDGSEYRYLQANQGLEAGKFIIVSYGKADYLDSGDRGAVAFSVGEIESDYYGWFLTDGTVEHQLIESDPAEVGSALYSVSTGVVTAVPATGDKIDGAIVTAVDEDFLATVVLSDPFCDGDGFAVESGE